MIIKQRVYRCNLCCFERTLEEQESAPDICPSCNDGKNKVFTDK